jgi:hypothetical protein
MFASLWYWPKVGYVKVLRHAVFGFVLVSFGWLAYFDWINVINIYESSSLSVEPTYPSVHHDRLFLEEESMSLIGGPSILRLFLWKQAVYYNLFSIYEQTILKEYLSRFWNFFYHTHVREARHIQQHCELTRQSIIWKKVPWWTG